MFSPVNAYEVSGGMIAGGGLSRVKFANATRSTIGTTSIVSAVSGAKIRVLHYEITVAAAVNVQFKSASDNLGSNKALAAGVCQTYCPHGLFETAVGEALSFAIDGAVATYVQVVYIEVA